MKVLTNYVKLKLPDSIEIFAYTVKFSPDLPASKLKCMAIKQLDNILPVYVYDDFGNNLYLQQEFTLESDIINCKEILDGYSFAVKIPSLESDIISVEIIIRRIQFNILSFCTTLIRKTGSLIGYMCCKNGLYDTRTLLHDYDIEIYSGFTYGVKQGPYGFVLSMNPSSVVRRLDTVLSFRELFDSKENPKEQFEQFIASRVLFTPTRSILYHPIHGVLWDMNPESLFNYCGQNISYTSFYKTYYEICIEDLSQPLLFTRKPKNQIHNQAYYQHFEPYIVSKENSDEILVIHIPELCHLSQINDQCKQDTSLNIQVRKHIDLLPSQVHHITRRHLNKIIESEICTSFLKQWNIELDPSFLEVKGRQLPGPKIRLNASTVLDFENSDNLEPHLEFIKLAAKVQFHSTVPLLYWILICQETDTDLAEIFKNIFQNESQRLNMEFPSVNAICELILAKKSSSVPLEMTYVDTLRDHCQKGKPQFIVFILPKKNKDLIYRSVKNLCCHELNVVSQGIKAVNLRERGVVGIVRKIVTQINCKLGGVPWVIESEKLEKEAIMFVGIDAHHHIQQNRYFKRSTFAAVFTLNSECSKFYTRVIFQNPQQETGDCLTTIFFDAYVEFFKVSGRWPTKVIVFRDGISTAYFKLLEAHEIPQIRRSMELMEPQPKLIVVLVKKYSDDKLLALRDDKICNPTPGTVVDQIVSSTEHKEFYIYSKLQIEKECVRPIRCFILVDDTNDVDYIQQMTYLSSFGYFNWPGSLRMPCVCQYAHKAAGFVGNCLEEIVPPSFDTLLYYI